MDKELEKLIQERARQKAAAKLAEIDRRVDEEAERMVRAQLRERDVEQAAEAASDALVAQALAAREAPPVRTAQPRVGATVVHAAPRAARRGGPKESGQLEGITTEIALALGETVQRAPVVHRLSGLDLQRLLQQDAHAKGWTAPAEISFRQLLRSAAIDAQTRDVGAVLRFDPTMDVSSLSSLPNRGNGFLLAPLDPAALRAGEDPGVDLIWLLGGNGHVTTLLGKPLFQLRQHNQAAYAPAVHKRIVRERDQRLRAYREDPGPVRALWNIPVLAARPASVTRLDHERPARDASQATPEPTPEPAPAVAPAVVAVPAAAPAPATPVPPPDDRATELHALASHVARAGHPLLAVNVHRCDATEKLLRAVAPEVRWIESGHESLSEATRTLAELRAGRYAAAIVVPSTHHRDHTNRAVIAARAGRVLLATPSGASTPSVLAALRVLERQAAERAANPEPDDAPAPAADPEPTSHALRFVRLPDDGVDPPPRVAAHVTATLCAHLGRVGRPLLVVGAVENTSVATWLRATFGAVDWEDCYRRSGTHRDEAVAERVRHGSYGLVVVLNGMLDHKTVDRVCAAARASATPLAFGHRGGIGKVVEALEKLERQVTLGTNAANPVRTARS